MMTIEKALQGAECTLRLEGRLDTTTAPQLEEAIKEVAPGLTRLTLDFGGVQYVSSAGLRVLLAAQKTMSAQGRMTLVGVSEAVSELFDITGFTDILTIE